MYFDFDYYKDKNVAIHCKSKTQAKKLCKLMHKNGLKWKSGDSYYNRIGYKLFEDQICYTLKGLCAPFEFYKRNNYIIIEFEDIVSGKYDRRKKMFTKKDLKNGDYIKLRNGEMGMYIVNGGFVNEVHSLNDSAFLDDLTYRSDTKFDIIEVRRMRHEGVTPIFAAFTRTYEHTVIYKRKDPILWNGMTYEEAHRALWNALADGEINFKSAWFKDYDNIPYQQCFACEAALHKMKTVEGNVAMCQFCPLCNIGKENDCLNGLYDRWNDAKGFEKFKLAHEIANLPWKEK